MYPKREISEPQKEFFFHFHESFASKSFFIIIIVVATLARGRRSLLLIGRIEQGYLLLFSSKEKQKEHNVK